MEWCMGEIPLDHPLHMGFVHHIPGSVTQIFGFWGFWSSSSLQTQKSRALLLDLDLLCCRCFGNVISPSLNLSSPQEMVKNLRDETLSRPNEFYLHPFYLFAINS